MSTAARTSITLADAAPELAAAQARLQRAAYPGSVDLVTRELLRILSGRLTNCRMCRNLRMKAAIDRGLDESMLDHLDDPDRSGLPQRQQVVLRLTLAFMNDPAGFNEADWAELHSHYSEEQAAELLLDLVRFRPGSKLVVAAGAQPEGDELVYA